MSTDYGLHCQDCNKTSICPDNMDSNNVREIMCCIPQAKAFKLALNAFPISLYVESYFCEPSQFMDLLDFVVEHADHHLVMADEYDWKYDEQDKRIE
jgi:hypothetical protein